MTRLSFIGKGKNSINIAKAAPISAIKGETKINPAKNAKKNPPKQPSMVLVRLNGKGFFEIVPPIIEAVLSPRANIAIAALLAGGEKRINVNRIPNAKKIGAKVNSLSSDGEAAKRVILAKRGNFFPLSLRNSEAEYDKTISIISKAMGKIPIQRANIGMNIPAP